jgi:uncharacterized protein (DUF1330 family)
MPTYLIVEIEVTDSEMYETYRRMASTALQNQGEIIVRGGIDGTDRTDSLEGDWLPQRLVIIEFPTEEAARSFYFSDTYQEALKIRQLASHSKALFVTRQ